MRLFVSVDLPDVLADAVAGLQETFGDVPGLRYTDPEQAHVTLKFLGNTDASRVLRIEAALETSVESAGVDPFDARVGGLGVFPSMDYISVVWVGVREGSAELTRLHEAVERETTAIGFDPEDHEFTPHVTLARMDDARGKERVQRVVREQDPMIGTMRVSGITLKKSELGEDGPTYSTVRRIGL